MNKFLASARDFVRGQDGSEVVEYALIIAVVCIGLVVALGAATGGLQSSFTALVTRVSDCFTGPSCS